MQTALLSISIKVPVNSIKYSDSNSLVAAGTSPVELECNAALSNPAHF